MTAPLIAPPQEDGARPLQARILRGAQGFADVRDDWQTLFQSIPESTWSYAPEVFASWIETLRDASDVYIVTVRDRSGRLRGLHTLMLDFTRRGLSSSARFDYDPKDRTLLANQRPRPVPLRQLTVMASLPATMLWVGPLCQPADCRQVYQAMASAILGLSGWDVFVLPEYEGTQTGEWCAAFQSCGARARVQTLNRDVSNLRQIGPFVDVVARQNGKFRQNVRRAQKVAAAEGMKIRMAVGADDVAAQFGAVETVARNSWKHQGRADAQVHIAYEGKQKRFFERLMASNTLGGTPLIAVASDADGPLAVLTLLQFGCAVTALLTFWDGRLAKSSPGMLLMGTAIDWAANHGATRFELNSTAPWVRYITDTTETVCNIVVFKPTLYGRALGQLARLSGRLP